MARKLKLNTFVIRIKRRNREQYVRFDEFFSYKLSDGTIVNQPFRDFFTKYAQSFEGKFFRQLKTNKALNLSDQKSRLGFNSANRTVNGVFKGGTTGFSSTIQPHDKADDEEAFVVTDQHVHAHAYRFVLWFPDDTDWGVFIMQGFGDSSITDIVKDHLSAFVREKSPEYKLQFNHFIAKETLDKFKTNPVVDKVILRRSKLDSNRAKHLAKMDYVPNGTINVEVAISGLKKLDGFGAHVNRFLNGEEKELFEIEDLREYGIDGDHETIIQFENDGQKASGSRSKEFTLAPDLYIPLADVLVSEKGEIDTEALKRYMFAHLDKVKSESGYTPTKKKT